MLKVIIINNYNLTDHHLCYFSTEWAIFVSRRLLQKVTKCIKLKENEPPVNKCPELTEHNKISLECFTSTTLRDTNCYSQYQLIKCDG